jgi:hypothetical protein
MQQACSVHIATQQQREPSVAAARQLLRLPWLVRALHEPSHYKGLYCNGQVAMRNCLDMFHCCNERVTKRDQSKNVSAVSAKSLELAPVLITRCAQHLDKLQMRIRIRNELSSVSSPKTTFTESAVSV